MDGLQFERETFEKRATTPGERAKLRREADILAAVAHPGVVRLIRFESSQDGDTLVIGQVGGSDLTAVGPLDGAEVAGLGAALATTLADIHDLGFAHGAVEAGHILLDGAGRPVLCGFGRATAGGRRQDLARARRQDLQALASLLAQLLPPGFPGRLRSTLKVAADGRRWANRGDARWLARRLTEVVPGARLPAIGTPRPDRGQPNDVPDEMLRPRSGRRCLFSISGGPRRWAVAGTVALVAGSMLAGELAGGRTNPAVAIGRPGVTAAASRQASTPSSGAATTLACPAIDDGCSPAQGAAGQLVMPFGRFRMATTPGSQTVLGRWACGALATPATLDARTGDIWVFDSWPVPAGRVTGRFVTRVPSASTLQVRPSRSGCDLLVVTGRDGPLAVIDPIGR